MFRSTFAVITAMTIGIAILCGLGTWQWQRLIWKEALIARVTERLANAPEPIQTVLANGIDQQLEYTPVELEGVYLQGNEALEFTTYNGQTGWHVFSPFNLAAGQGFEAGQTILVNRGFVPYDQSIAANRAQPVGEDMTRITGLFRIALTQKPGYFVNENAPEKQVYFWRDINTMQLNSGLKGNKITGWYLDLGLPGVTQNSNALPIAGTTLVSFSNNHLQYLVTWYGLALALLGVGSYFLYSRRKTKKDESFV
jgi:surfeit locus 1 family protein